MNEEIKGLLHEECWDTKLGKKLYNEGVRFLRHSQFSKLYTPLEGEHTATTWGSGLYKLEPNGTKGECIHFNYDSSG